MAQEFDALRAQPTADLVASARGLGIENPAGQRRQDLVAAIVRERAGGGMVDAEGVLEILADGFGFLRGPGNSFAAGGDDIYVSPSQIRRFNLRTGDLVRGQVRAPKENERYFALVKVERVNELDPEVARSKILFDNLTPVWPTRSLKVGSHDPLCRLVDLLCPIARGQRVLVSAPPRGGRTGFFSSLAKGIAAAHPEVVVILLLVGDRPEDITEARQNHGAAVLASAGDEGEVRHVQVADIALERARRLVELGRDVVLLVDSLTRLARASQGSQSPSGRVLPGEIDAAALARVRTLFGAARAVEEGGSLTVVGAGVEGGSFDRAVLEELRGLENHHIVLTGPGRLDLLASRSYRESSGRARRARLRDALVRSEDVGAVLRAWPDDAALYDALAPEA